MSLTLFTNVRIFDGTGMDLFPGEVLVEGNRIKAVSKAGERIDRTGAEIIDGGGATLTPGLIESHAHLGFGATVDRRFKWRELQPEQHMLVTAEAGKTMLDFGFTSAYSGGAANAKFEVALRKEYAEGWLPGPRLKACSFERSASAGAKNVSGAYAGISVREPDVEGIRNFVTEMVALGVDSVKFVVTGESAVRPGTSRVLQFYDEELAAGAAVAKEAGVWLNGHCHSAESVKMALKHGFRVLYHCTWADEEALDMLEAKKDSIFVAPGPGVNYAAIYEAADYGITREMAIEQEQVETLERVSRIMPELHKRGVRVLPGGDYGFPWNPIGKNARDMELFVTHFGLSPNDALRAATKLGGEIMGMGEELGLIKAGYLADILLVDGDPLKDIKLFQDRNKLLAVMKDGKFHKSPQAPVRKSQAAAA
ncbi:MAG: amidohydrolase family protein [Steroidobacteraceae bacterium]